jgi:hypothetical protein
MKAPRISAPKRSFSTALEVGSSTTPSRPPQECGRTRRVVLITAGLLWPVLQKLGLAITRQTS